MLRSPRTFALLAAAAVALLATALRADIDVAVANGDKVTGTLLPADEVESFRVLVPEGAVFKLKVKGRPRAKGQPKPPVTLRLFEPGGAEVAQGDVVVKGTSASLKGYRAATTGEYRIQVEGDGTTPGDYQLVVKWKSPKKLTFDMNDTGPGAPSRVGIPVDAGALLTIKLKAERGSPATPVAERLEGASGFERDLAPPAPGATSHKVKKEVVPVFGVATLQASGGGAYSASVSIRPPKPAKRKIDLSGKAIGGDAANGGDVAVGRIVAPDGGAVAVTTDVSDVIGGSSVVVPAGALAEPTSIFIGTAPALPVQDGGAQAAGPTVFFGPEGLTFQEDVLVTIPFDVDLFGGDPGALTLFTQDAEGNVSEIDDFVVDLENGTVAFQVSHFSSFRVFAPRLPAPVEGDLDFDGVGDLVLRAPDNGAGRVYVAPGGSGIAQLGSTSAAPVVLTGAASAGRFGEVVAVADLNQDGREDLAVTAPFAGVNGRVYVFYGGQGFASRGAASADVVFSGQDLDRGFGIRVATGDVNGDGADDLVVGAESSSIVVRTAGAAYVFFGGREITSRNAEHADVVLTGTKSGERFGASVAVGDVTGDGFDDVLVGADETVRDPQSGTLTAIGPGKVLVFAGGPDLRSLRSSKADFRLTGRELFSTFGLETAVGDVDGDGVADVLVAAAKDDGAGTDAGAVLVYRGGSLRDAPVELTGATAGDQLGFQILARDLDGDDRAEAVATSILVGNQAGAAYVFAGASVFPSQSSSSAAATLTGEAAGDFLAILQEPWDVTGDGRADLVLYAPQAGSAGRAYVFPGGPSLPQSGSAGQAPIVIDGQSGDLLGGNP